MLNFVKKIRKIIAIITLVVACQSNLFSQQSETQIAIMYYNNHEWDKALELFSDLYNKNPNTFNYSYLSSILFNLEKYEDAEKIINKHLKKYPEDYRALVDKGYSMKKQNQQGKASKFFDKIIKDLIPNQNSIRNLAYAFNAREEYDYAINSYLHGREILNNPTEFNAELGYMYQITGQWNKMIDEYIALAKQNDNQNSLIKNRLQYWLSDDLTGEKKEVFKNIMLDKLKKEPNEILYNDLLYWFSIQQKDFELALLQAIALDKRYNENGNRVFELAELCVNNESFTSAIDAFNYLISKDESEALTIKSKIELAKTKYLQSKSQLNLNPKTIAEVENDYQNILKTYGENSNTFSALLYLANLKAFNNKEYDNAISILERAINIANVSSFNTAEAKLELADIYLYIGEQWEATLLYSQVEKAFKNEPIGHEAKFRNARLSYFIGEFEWAKAQLNILRGATSKLISNDAMDLYIKIIDNVAEDSLYIPLLRLSQAELKIFQGDNEKGLEILKKLIENYPGHLVVDDALFQIANVYQDIHDYENAALYFQKVVDNYYYDLLADDALYSLAKLYELKLNDKTKAIELYQNIIVQFPNSIYVIDARKKLRALKDNLKTINNL